MSNTLTAAGVKLCMSLGLLNPTHETCSIAIMQVQPMSDSFSQSPAKLTSIPNRMSEEQSNVADGYDGCVNYGTYETYTGRTDEKGELIMEDNGSTEGGKSYFCWRRASIVWIPEAGRWRWVFP